MKIKKGDTVVVISGKDKGKEGTVSRVMPRTNQVELPVENKRIKTA